MPQANYMPRLVLVRYVRRRKLSSRCEVESVIAFSVDRFLGCPSPRDRRYHSQHKHCGYMVRDSGAAPRLFGGDGGDEGLFEGGASGLGDHPTRYLPTADGWG